MTKFALILVAGMIAPGLLGFSQGADADPIVSAVSHTANASAGTTSGDYHYGIFGSPRTGIHRGWLIRREQATTSSADAPLGGSSGVQTSTGSFFGPVYSGTGLATSTFSDTDTLSTLHVQLKAAVTLTTPKIGHESVSASAQAYDAFTFTLVNDSYVRLDSSGSSAQTVKIVDLYSGEAIFTANGSGTFHDTLAAGDYEVVGSVADSASQDTQYNLLTNLGSTAFSLDYTLSVSPPT